MHLQVLHDARHLAGVDGVAFEPGRDREQVCGSQIVNCPPMTHGPFSSLFSISSEAFHHGRGHFALHRLDRHCIVGPPGAAPAMRVRDMHGRAKIAVELLHLREGKRIGERREFGGREALRQEDKQGGSLRKRAVFGHQRGNPPFRIHRKVFRASLSLRTEIDLHRLVGRAGLFERDVRRKRTSSGRIVELEHEIVLSTTGRRVGGPVDAGLRGYFDPAVV